MQIYDDDDDDDLHGDQRSNVELMHYGYQT